jgi:hypothetical protein
LVCLSIFVPIPWSLLLWICKIIWIRNEVLWYLHACSFTTISGLFYGYPGVFCAPKWILGWIFIFLWKMTLEFNGDCIESIDCFQYYGHFHNIISADLWIWEFFPSSSVFFSLILQCFYNFHCRSLSTA